MIKSKGFIWAVEHAKVYGELLREEESKHPSLRPRVMAALEACLYYAQILTQPFAEMGVIQSMQEPIVQAIYTELKTV